MWKTIFLFLISGWAIIWACASTKMNTESSTRVDKTRNLILTALIDDKDR